MNYFDTHIHLQDFKLQTADEIINQALHCGVDKMICASVVEKDWEEIAQLHEKYPQTVIPAFGLHPWYLEKAEDGWENRLAEYLEKYPLALVGEAGLDRYKNKEYEPQNEIFKKHIELSKKYRRPLLIHAVKVQDWFEEYWQNLPEKFVFHSYNGRSDMVKKIVQSGGYVSFSASILRNKDIKEVVAAVPFNRVLFETDGPYQSLEQGAESLPEFIPEEIKKVSEIIGIPEKQLATQAYENSLEFIKTW